MTKWKWWKRRKRMMRKRTGIVRGKEAEEVKRKFEINKRRRMIDRKEEKERNPK